MFDLSLTAHGTAACVAALACLSLANWLMEKCDQGRARIHAVLVWVCLATMLFLAGSAGWCFVVERNDDQVVEPDEAPKAKEIRCSHRRAGYTVKVPSGREFTWGAID